MIWKFEKRPANQLIIQAFESKYLRECRDDRIRTCGPYVPNVVRYRAALHPEIQRPRFTAALWQGDQVHKTAHKNSGWRIKSKML